ncbi:MAG: hypothetical protein Q7T07_16915 [Burkholderiaceae bacterium]|nr:hypothetical protein [Burkholderiaceae bacterium]
MHTLSGELSHGTAACADGVGLPAVDLLLEVDFKWLMAGQGCWVDPTRLRADPLYAASCLRTALRSPCEALQGCARFLQTALGLQ